MAWTHFSDNYSGGVLKTAFEEIYIELPESEAIAYFEKVFDASPYGEYCDCCGYDYGIRQADNINTVARGGRTLTISKEDIGGDVVKRWSFYGGNPNNGL